jgi:hypothetical protein
MLKVAQPHGVGTIWAHGQSTSITPFDGTMRRPGIPPVTYLFHCILIASINFLSRRMIAVRVALQVRVWEKDPVYRT